MPVIVTNSSILDARLWQNCSVSEHKFNVLVTGCSAYQPATPVVLSQGGCGTEVLLMATKDRLPFSHPTKREKPQPVYSY